MIHSRQILQPTFYKTPRWDKTISQVQNSNHPTKSNSMKYKYKQVKTWLTRKEINIRPVSEINKRRVNPLLPCQQSCISEQVWVKQAALRRCGPTNDANYTCLWNYTVIDKYNPSRQIPITVSEYTALVASPTVLLIQYIILQLQAWPVWCNPRIPRQPILSEFILYARPNMST